MLLMQCASNIPIKIDLFWFLILVSYSDETNIVWHQRLKSVHSLPSSSLHFDGCSQAGSSTSDISSFLFFSGVMWWDGSWNRTVCGEIATGGRKEKAVVWPLPQTAEKTCRQSLCSCLWCRHQSRLAARDCRANGHTHTFIWTWQTHTTYPFPWTLTVKDESTAVN